MPNHCTNWLDVVGDTDSIAEFRKVVTTPSVHDRKEEEEGTIKIYQRTYPCPLEYYESDKWYAWCNTHWGTKWGDYDTELVGESPTHLNFQFTTAWGPGVDGILNISRKFPTLVFVGEYEESGMCFCGAYSVQNGDILAEYEGTYPETEATEDGDYDFDAQFAKLTQEMERCKRVVIDELSEETKSLFSATIV